MISTRAGGARCFAPGIAGTREMDLLLGPLRGCPYSERSATTISPISRR